MKLADKIKALPRKSSGLYSDLYRLGVLDAAELATAHDALMQQMAEALQNLLDGMEASGGWEGDDDLFDAGAAALRAYKEQQ